MTRMQRLTCRIVFELIFWVVFGLLMYGFFYVMLGPPYVPGLDCRGEAENCGERVLMDAGDSESWIDPDYVLNGQVYQPYPDKDDVAFVYVYPQGVSQDLDLLSVSYESWLPLIETEQGITFRYCGKDALQPYAVPRP